MPRHGEMVWVNNVHVVTWLMGGASELLRESYCTQAQHTIAHDVT